MRLVAYLKASGAAAVWVKPALRSGDPDVTLFPGPREVLSSSAIAPLEEYNAVFEAPDYLPMIYSLESLWYTPGILAHHILGEQHTVASKQRIVDGSKRASAERSE